jgi:hypothetical protein
MTEIETLERKKELKLQLIRLTEEEIKAIDEFILKLKREGKR